LLPSGDLLRCFLTSSRLPLGSLLTDQPGGTTVVLSTWKMTAGPLMRALTAIPALS
jgi:hypothetical protein